MRLAAVVAIAGCSVADVDLAGKQCPCSSTYVCDEPTQTCVRPGGDAGADTGDGPTAHSCLGSDPTTSPMFSDPFDNLVRWAIPAGIWMATGGEALSAKTDTYSYAFPILTTAANDYRVVTTVRQVDHTDVSSAYEIAFRVQGQTGEMFHCNWEPNDHHIVIQHTGAGGQLSNVLADQMIPVPASFDPLQPVTLELEMMGSMVTCCVREVPGSMIQSGPITLPSGPPGIKSWKMQAAYTDFAIY
jgi:hypothetical protein